jgi:hypothetical protein
MKKLFRLAFLLLLPIVGWAQPGNDNWKDAYEIDLTSGVTGSKIISGQKTSFKKASIENFETFPRALKLVALNKKTVWYKFKTLSPQKITVTLKQNDTIISPQDLGMVVYDGTGFYPQPQDKSYTFASLTHIGETSNNCLPPGEYFVQVCARKNVNDSVWINITAEPSNEPGNTIENAVEIDSVSHENFTRYGCFSLESVEEAEPYDTAHFKRSGYLKFTTPDSLGECKFIVSGYQFAYLLYEGNPIDSSSWKLLDSLSTYKLYKTKKHLFRSSCDGVIRPNTTYFIKVLTGLNGNFRISNFTLETNKVSAGSNPKDEIVNLGKFSNNGSTYFNDYINCGENGTEYLCNNLEHLLIDTIWQHPVFDPIIDTMNFGTWAEFELENHFSIRYEGYDTRNSNYGLTNRKKSWLFKGSYGDSNFCNQTPINLDTYSECIPPGKYTVFTGFYRNNITYNDTSYNDFFGNRIYYELDFYKRDSFIGNPASFFDEKYPAQYVNILAGGSEIDQRKLDPDWLGGPYRELEIDGIEIKGHCSFYTFDLTKDAWVYLSAKGYREYWHYVFEGDCRKGLDSLGKYVGNNVRGYLLEPTYNFDQLKKGTYTIIAFRAKSTPCNHPKYYQTNYILKATTIEDEKKEGGDWKCTPLFQFAKTAGQVNEGKVLTCKEPKNSNEKTSYKVPATCLDETNNRGNVHWYNKKKYPGLRGQYAYLEFELKDKSDVFFHTNTHFQVLKGFISKDSSIAKNEKNVAVEHAYAQHRDCAFPAGKYTLVIHGAGTYWFNIEVGYARINEADHAANAKSLGLISRNNPIVSESAQFNCNSTFSETDYIKEANTWFTFRVAGRGKVYLSGINQDSYQYSIIAQGSRSHYLSFDELKKSGSIDSIAGDNQELLYALRETNRKYIFKNTTDTIRYYVLANSRLKSGVFNLQVEFEYDSLATNNGDYCSNAVKESITGNGNLQLGQWASIHTIGEAANEQFKNQLHSPYYNIEDLKTTWFSVDFKNVQGSKLFVSGSNSNAYEIKVYRGDCSAMTLVGALSSWQNISLDCIQDGTYMFQLYSNAQLHDSVMLNIQVLPANGICPMVDPQRVIANFDFTNGCAGDTIQFINLSSAGTAIAYEWKFGNNDISTQANPSRIFKGVDDSLLVSLVVRNKTTLESDTAYEWIYLEKPELELIEDTLVCENSVSLEIENFDAGKYIYGWHSANRYIRIDGVEQLFTYGKGRRYTYSLWADTVNQIIVSARNKTAKPLIQ